MTDSHSPIGVFDSGIGGLTAVRELVKLMPNEDIIYLGDTARVPYGTKSPETIRKYARQDFDFLLRFGVKMIIAACGTVSSTVGDSEFGGVMQSGNGVLYTGVIRPAVNAAVSSTKNGRIGIIGTSATIRSGSYKNLIKSIMPKAEVFEKACPMFVPLVENGYIGLECRPCVDIAEEYLEPLKQAGVDTLILGCTHYPMLSDVIAKIMGDGVTLISSGGEAGKTAYNMLRENGLANDSRVKGKTTLYCTDSVELFRENAEHFLYDLENENIEIKSAELY